MKFRYCFYCKKPVTKQNFRSRHLHANLDPNNKEAERKPIDKLKEENKSKTEICQSKESNANMPSTYKATTKPQIAVSESNSVKLSKSLGDKNSIDSSPALPSIKRKKEENSRSTEAERAQKIPKLLLSELGP